LNLTIESTTKMGDALILDIVVLAKARAFARTSVVRWTPLGPHLRGDDASLAKAVTHVGNHGQTGRTRHAGDGYRNSLLIGTYRALDIDIRSIYTIYHCLEVACQLAAPHCCSSSKRILSQPSVALRSRSWRRNWDSTKPKSRTTLLRAFGKSCWQERTTLSQHPSIEAPATMTGTTLRLPPNNWPSFVNTHRSGAGSH